MKHATRPKRTLVGMDIWIARSPSVCLARRPHQTPLSYDTLASLLAKLNYCIYFYFTL